uniref:mRNA export factor GLE1 n=1 Tax=Saccoglossus kowalevskii TaxID=10224 RepID=A0ABM0MWE3_SACKO|nr:PREDICTED: nucleoporin GLE1-like [Saccoglossus kowalevskii]
MTGICRLYAAILQQPSPKEPRHPHPHGLDNGWKWFSRIMNLEPRNDITATLIYDMLQVCGHKVTSLYRKQFIKILGILIKDFYPLIEKVTIPGSGGSVSRLKTFLETCFKNNAVPPPKGTLPSNLWRS